jgi:ribosomal peptide maturation radical SAM protein 1
MTSPGLLEHLWSSGSHEPARIALVNVPFASTNTPSIQCGLLKAVLARAGHIVNVYYLNLELACEIGPKNYETISDGRYANSLLGDWLFSSAAFGYREDEEEYLAALPALKGVCDELDFNWLCKLRKEILPGLVQRWTKQVDWSSFHAVGFTSTFVQKNACFALARSIKRQNPQVATIFGGANFDGGMGKEFLRKLPFIDYVVDGEGEEALLELANRLAKGESGIGIQGVSSRTEDGIADGGRARKVRSLDSLPEPSYEEYFETLWRLGQEKVISNISPGLLMETARGCWWGEKHHCTFCGLNANDMAFRSKTPERVLSELRNLTGHYQTLHVVVVDNIMNMGYVEKVCGPLIQDRCDYQMFWEVKANLTPLQLKAMVDAGIVQVQPGIESLSTHVLGLMRKGITMLKNVRFLKWANYFRINCDWNLLTGFPGETVEDYAQQRRLIPLLKHLQPPIGNSRIWLERYSPYFFDPSFPVEDIRPAVAYRFVYPESEINLKEVAYFFDYKMGATIPVECHEELFSLVEEWRASWKKSPHPILKYRRGPDWIEIIDRREEQPRNHWLYGAEASIYESCCETDRTLDAVCRSLRSETGSGEMKDVEAAVQKFCELGIMIAEDGHYLSLAQPLNRNWFVDRATMRSAPGSQTLEPSLSRGAA